MKTILLTAVLLPVLAALSRAENGYAKIVGTAEKSTISGSVAFEDTDKGLKISASISGLTEGGHGFHIHESGSCEDMGKAAGGHYNPAHASHGEALKSGVDKAHAGDMGNIVADAKGQATLSIVLPGVTVSNSKTAVAGRSVVIHEKIDDFSQPTGNAGGRIACGIIGIMTPQAPATPAPTKNK